MLQSRVGVFPLSSKSSQCMIHQNAEGDLYFREWHTHDCLDTDTLTDTGQAGRMGVGEQTEHNWYVLSV